MDYLVVAPHTPFFQWQVALLAQSFRLIGMEENLAILLVAGNEPPVQSHFCDSFSGHPRLRAVRLLCDSDPDIVRLHGLTYAIESGLVGQTFTLLPPHSVFRSPIPEPTANITVSCKSDFTFPHLDGFGISSNAIGRRISGERNWLPVGDVFVFNGLMPSFFKFAIARGEMIAFDSARELLRRGEDYMPKSVFRAAMSLVIMESYGRLSVDTSRRLECHMNEQDGSSNIINYYYGSPPAFSRTFYPMNGKLVTFSDDPYQGIMRADDTLPTSHMKAVASSLIPSSQPD